jgi:hypothetical protein
MGLALELVLTAKTGNRLGYSAKSAYPSENCSAFTKGPRAVSTPEQGEVREYWPDMTRVVFAPEYRSAQASTEVKARASMSVSSRQLANGPRAVKGITVKAVPVLWLRQV